MPDALFIVDIRKERSAVLEAKRRGLTVIAIVDTNTDPEEIDYPIPANDDAVGSIQLISNAIAVAYAEGIQLKQKKESEEQEKKAAQTPASQAEVSPASPEKSIVKPKIVKKKTEKKVESVKKE
jgi:small subunit ribosomal protein S2